MLDHSANQSFCGSIVVLQNKNTGGVESIKEKRPHPMFKGLQFW